MNEPEKCHKCGKAADNGLRSCSRCRERGRARTKKYRQRRVEAGRCRCGNVIHFPYSLCNHQQRWRAGKRGIGKQRFICRICERYYREDWENLRRCYCIDCHAKLREDTWDKISPQKRELLKQRILVRAARWYLRIPNPQVKELLETNQVSKLAALLHL